VEGGGISAHKSFGTSSRSGFSMKQCSSGSLAGILVSIGSSAGSGSGVMMCFVSSIGSVTDSGIIVCVGSFSERNAYFGDSCGSVFWRNFVSRLLFYVLEVLLVLG
jgi:hypothetical protein